MKYVDKLSKFCASVGDYDKDLPELLRKVISMQVQAAMKKDKDYTDPSSKYYSCYGDCQACEVYAFALWLDFTKEHPHAS